MPRGTVGQRRKIAGEEQIGGSPQRRRGAGRKPIGRAQIHRPEGHDFAAGQNDLHREDRLVGETVPQPARSGRIGRDDAPDRPGREETGIRGEEAVSRAFEQIVEPFAHRPGLNHDGGVVADLDDPPHIAGKIEDQPPSDRPAAGPRPASARMDRDTVLGAVANRGGDVLGRLRPEHPDRKRLKIAGVGAVQLRDDRVAPHIAGDQAAQIVLDSFLLRRQWHRLSSKKRPRKSATFWFVRK